jgi:hypothetical protein
MSAPKIIQSFEPSNGIELKGNTTDKEIDEMVNERCRLTEE